MKIRSFISVVMAVVLIASVLSPIGGTVAADSFAYGTVLQDFESGTGCVLISGGLTVSSTENHRYTGNKAVCFSSAKQLGWSDTQIYMSIGNQLGKQGSAALSAHYLGFHVAGLKGNNVFGGKYAIQDLQISSEGLWSTYTFNGVYYLLADGTAQWQAMQMNGSGICIPDSFSGLVALDLSYFPNSNREMFGATYETYLQMRLNCIGASYGSLYLDSVFCAEQLAGLDWCTGGDGSSSLAGKGINAAGGFTYCVKADLFSTSAGEVSLYAMRDGQTVAGTSQPVSSALQFKTGNFYLPVPQSGIYYPYLRFKGDSGAVASCGNWRLTVYLGDINGDRNVNAADMILMKRRLLFGSGNGYYDVTGDGLVNVSDLVRIKRNAIDPVVPETEKNYRFSMPLLSGDRTAVLCSNPNRGFRLENYMSVENGRYTPDVYDSNGNYKGNVGATAIRMLEYLGGLYRALESPQVVQTYFYLTYFRNSDLNQTAVNYMNAYFDACRKAGVTVALRFAYIFNAECREKQDCVSISQMLRHIEQIKPVLAANRDVIFCLEAGMMGEWGEQSGESPWIVNGYAGQVMNALAAAVPDDLWIVTRYYSVYKQASAEAKRKIGFHNDYICGFSHPWDTAGTWDTADYAAAKALSATHLFEGEMPWGAQLPEGVTAFDGLSVVRYLAENHYTVLSCYHNNREGDGNYDMKKWRNQSVTPSVLSQNGLPYYDRWFQTASGQPVSRSLFEYLQQHLGYLLAVSDVNVSRRGEEITASFGITNYGFAAPLAMKAVRLVLLDSAGNIVESRKICETVELSGNTTKACAVSMTLPDHENTYRIGLYVEAPNGKGARLANELTTVNGVNVLGTLSN